MQITTYLLATGEFGAVRSGPDLESLVTLLRPTQGFKEGNWSRETHKVDLETGEIVEKPADEPAATPPAEV